MNVDNNRENNGMGEANDQENEDMSADNGQENEVMGEANNQNNDDMMQLDLN